MPEPVANPSEPTPEVDPLAAALAWVLPGLGHIKKGDRKRGGLIMFGVLFLFVGGVLIGGVDCVDRKNDKLWFIAQAVCGPIAFVTDSLNQKLTKQYPPHWQYVYETTEPGEAEHDRITELLRRVSLGRVNEMGTLFCALAGLMNLVAILDAFYCIPKPQPKLIERRKAVNS